MNTSQIQVNLYAMYLFNPSGEVRPYLKAGVLESFAVNNNNDIYDAWQSTTTDVSNGVVSINGSDQETIGIRPIKNLLVDLNVGAGISAGNHRW